MTQKSKTYQAITALHLATEVWVKSPDGQGKTKRRVVFSGGIRSPRRIPGTFSTNDPVLQEALESDTGFNKSWRLKKEKLLEKEKQEVANTIKESMPEEQPASLVVDDVTTVKSAKEYLTEKHGIKVSELPNRNAVIAKAKEVNVEFPNLN